jgi:hypothetical protein
MTLRLSLLLFAAVALILTGCAQREWQEVTPSSRRLDQKSPQKRAINPPEEDDSEQPKYDLLR